MFPSSARDLLTRFHPSDGVIGTIVHRRDLPLPPRTWPAIGLAFVGFATPVIGFVELAERISADSKLPFDQPLMTWLRGRHSPSTTRAMTTITHLGGVYAVPAFALATAGYLARFRHSRRPAAFLAISLIGSTAINSALKVMYKRNRPTYFQHIVQEKSYSFPSGHAMASAALATCTCVIAWPTRWRLAAMIGSAAYVPAVGVTRMYLGVHYPSDILAGWCVSVAWVGEVATIMWIMDRLELTRDLPGVGDPRR